MATIKSYTDIEQSKKLAEILPIKTADMFYNEEPEDESYPKDIVDTEYPMVLREVHKHLLEEYGIPCWSLAALLGVLPVIIGDVLSKNSLRLRIDKSETNFNVWYDNLDSGMVEEGLDIIKSNAVDACYEMIIKLHELKML